jgi:hypothetical protein
VIAGFLILSDEVEVFSVASSPLNCRLISDILLFAACSTSRQRPEKAARLFECAELVRRQFSSPSVADDVDNEAWL